MPLETRNDDPIDLVTEGVRLAIRSAEAGHWDTARQQLDEAEAALNALSPSLRAEHRAIGLEAAIADGRGQISLREGKVEAALPFLERALERRLAEEAAGGTPPPLAIPVNLVNLTGATFSLGRPADALAHNTMAIARLRPLDLPPARVFLAAALEARGNLLAQAGQFPEARVALEESTERARALLAEGAPNAGRLLTEILLVRSRVEVAAKDLPAALAFTATAADSAWERFESNPETERPALSEFVSAQMQLMGITEELGQFGQAEDALFKVLRLVGPDPRVMARGKAFYESLMKLDDSRLESGNLPRDEVQESYLQLADLARQVAERARATA